MHVLLFFIAFLTATGSALDGRFEKWAKLRTPYPGPSRVIGFYSAGCLAGGEKLALDGPGYSVMRVSRRRIFMHPEMKTYLQQLAQSLRGQGLPLLLIGDISAPRGGPTISGHNSHQGGLDADLWLRMSTQRPTLAQKESWGAIRYVQGRKKLLSNWGSNQTKLVITAAEFENINRIFLAPAIKKYFCDHYPTANWQYKLRAWWGHEEHIHVRLHCPADSPQCINQTPALDPGDSGCDDELPWWYSKEADDEWQKIISAPGKREFPSLPSECEVMVR